jgi:hypothetical protein
MQGSIVIETVPVTAFAMRQAKILFQFPELALNVPAHLGNEDRLRHYCVTGCPSQPVVDWFGVGLWPFDPQPFSLLKWAIMRRSIGAIPTRDPYHLSSVGANS